MRMTPEVNPACLEGKKNTLYVSITLQKKEEQAMFPKTFS